MRADTFKSWLTKKGCRFDASGEDRGEGHASLEIKLADRRSTLPLVGTHQDIPPTEVSRILHDLGLHAQELPGPVEERAPQFGARHDGFLAKQAKVARNEAFKDRNSSDKP